MITRELVHQWVYDLDAHMELGMAPVFHTHKQVHELCAKAAAYAVAQRDAELVGVVDFPQPDFSAKPGHYEPEAYSPEAVKRLTAAARLQEREHWRKYILDNFGLEID